MSGRASPGGATACSERCTVRSWLVKVPVFSPHIAAGRTTSANAAVSERNGSETIAELRFLLVVAAIAVVACIVLGFRGRSRPDVELTPGDRKLTTDERR